MIARDVRQRGDGEAHVVDPVQRERVGGDFHRDRAGAGIAHRREEPVQLDRQRRGVRELPAPIAKCAAERSDDAARDSRRFEHVAHEVRGGCLAVRSGHADHGERLRRSIVERVGERGCGYPRIRDDDDRHGAVQLSLGDDDGRAARDRSGDVRMTVEPLAAQRDEHRPRRGRARIGRDCFDQRRKFAEDARGRQGRNESRRLSHQRVPFVAASWETKRCGAAGMMPACSIAARASSANTGAATSDP